MGVSLKNVGGAVAGGMLGPVGAVVGGVSGGDGKALSKKWKDVTGITAANDAAGDAAAAGETAAQGSYETKKGVAQQMSNTDTALLEANKAQVDKYKQQRAGIDRDQEYADNAYSNSITGTEQEYQGKVDKLASQAEGQASDAKQTYTNTIEPAFKNSMEDAQTNAADAMSLKDAGDMNNSTQQGVRDFYEKQAVGQGKQGLADVGVLQSMGAQANAAQMGSGAPMTGSQMQLMNAQNMSQSGQAFANTQRRVQNLRDQGVQQGISMSNQQYDRGEAARDRRTSAARDYEGVGARMRDEQTGYRGEAQGYGQETRGSKSKVADTAKNRAYSISNRNLDRYGQEFNMDQQLSNQWADNRYKADNANAQAELDKYGRSAEQAAADQAAAVGRKNGINQMIGGGLQAGAQVVGSIYGGPAGGAAAGGAVGAMRPKDEPVPQSQGVAANMNRQSADPYEDYMSRGRRAQS